MVLSRVLQQLNNAFILKKNLVCCFYPRRFAEGGFLILFL